MVSEEKDIATVLLKKFFKELPERTVVSSTEPERATRETLQMDPIIETEVQRAVFAASSFKASGMDETPMVAWQKTWPIMKAHITALTQLSIHQAAKRQYLRNGRLPG
jgi:hypothetical protein